MARMAGMSRESWPACSPPGRRHMVAAGAEVLYSEAPEDPCRHRYPRPAQRDRMPVHRPSRPISRLLPLLVCLLAVPVPQSRAVETGEPYGDRLVRSGAGWRDGEAPPSRRPPAVAGGDGAVYRTAIEEALARGGPYGESLAEPLQGLARSLWARGDLGGARTVLARALHVLRVNEGLNSGRQLPLLRDLIELARETGDWAAVDDRYSYLYHLGGAGQPAATTGELGGHLDYFRWQREAVRLGLDGPAGAQRRLAELVQRNDDLLESSGPESEQPLSPEARWPLVQSQLRNLYLLQAAIPDSPGTLMVTRSSQFYALPGNELEAERRRLENLRHSGRSEGRRLLASFIETVEPGSDLARRARLALGDWLQWHGSSRAAADTYRELAAELAAAGEGDRLAAWFGEPVELPDDGAFWQAIGSGDEVSPPLLARFDISDSGRVRNLEMAPVEEDWEGAAGRLRRALYDTRFRPRLAEGEPVATAGLERRYLWLPLRRSRLP